MNSGKNKHFGQLNLFRSASADEGMLALAAFSVTGLTR
jgi:hypothetical protein